MEEVLLSGNREKIYRKPHLKCQLEKGTFEVILPPQMVRKSGENEYSILTWQVFSIKNKYEKKCSLEEGYSGDKTKELRIGLEPQEIFGEIQFLLFKGNELLRKFSWDKRKINFFDESGNWISGSSLESGNYFGFTEIETDISSEALLATSIRNNMKFWEFKFKAGDFVQICDENGYYIGDVPNIGLTRDNPLIYYLNQSMCEIAKDIRGNTAILPKYFFTKDKVKEYNRKIEKSVNELVAKLDLSNCSDYEKVLRVHDWFCKNIEYDKKGSDKSEVVRVIASHNIIGVFAHHKAQCEGIAKAVKVLLNTVDMKCIVVTGDANGIREKGPHAWNIISVDNTPYQLDVTWDIGASDISRDRLSYDYFLVSDSIMNQEHKTEEKLPECIFTRKIVDY